MGKGESTRKRLTRLLCDRGKVREEKQIESSA
jgi:hypothetical protein